MKTSRHNSVDRHKEKNCIRSCFPDVVIDDPECEKNSLKLKENSAIDFTNLCFLANSGPKHIICITILLLFSIFHLSSISMLLLSVLLLQLKIES